ncbi:MAG: hypothetical protein DRJ47_04190 [Thermoprotei archaeon]|nr:MAG: hypothetical protein DRJ47_04190 [Thermoprotei archaeon]
MICIIVGWVIAFQEPPKLSLSALYSLGSFFLALYAYYLGDLIFLILNTLATFVSLLNFMRRYVRQR